MWTIEYRKKPKNPTVAAVGRSDTKDFQCSGSRCMDPAAPCYLISQPLPAGEFEFVRSVGSDLDPVETRRRRDTYGFEYVEQGELMVCVSLTSGHKSAYYAKFVGYVARLAERIDVFVKDTDENRQLLRHLNKVGENMCNAHPESGGEFIFASADGKRVVIRACTLA